MDSVKTSNGNPLRLIDGGLRLSVDECSDLMTKKVIPWPRSNSGYASFRELVARLIEINIECDDINRALIEHSPLNKFKSKQEALPDETA